MIDRENELDKLEKLAESFSEMGDFTQLMRDSYTKLESKFEDLNSRLARVNKLLRQSLAERNRLANYLASILESLDSGVIVTDQKGIINIFNSAASRYTGLDVKKVLGASYFQLFDDSACQSARAVLSGSVPSASGEKQIQMTDGNVVPLAFSITRLRREGDTESTGMVEILHNLSETKKLENHLKQISTLAALGEMAATVAHEIRNPISGISGFTSLLLRDMAIDDENKRLVEKIASGVNTLESIVSNLLDFTKGVCPDSQKIDFVSLVEDTISDFKAVHDCQGHSITIENGSKRLAAYLDPHLFRQVVLNLIKNAVQAQPGGGKIRLVMSGDSSSGIILKVEDDGPGIKDEHFKRLFTPFFTTKSSGTGLGLATVKKLVELHGGRVSATNKPDGGASFVIEIPGREGGFGEAQNSDS